MSAERVCCPECAAEIGATYEIMMQLGLVAAHEVEGTLYGPRTSYYGPDGATRRVRLTDKPLELALYWDADAQSGSVECVRHCRILANVVPREKEGAA